MEGKHLQTCMEGLRGLCDGLLYPQLHLQVRHDQGTAEVSQTENIKTLYKLMDRWGGGDEWTQINRQAHQADIHTER